MGGLFRGGNPKPPVTVTRTTTLDVTVREGDHSVSITKKRGNPHITIGVTGGFACFGYGAFTAPAARVVADEIAKMALEP